MCSFQIKEMIHAFHDKYAIDAYGRTLYNPIKKTIPYQFPVGSCERGCW